MNCAKTHYIRALLLRVKGFATGLVMVEACARLCHTVCLRVGDQIAMLGKALAYRLAMIVVLEIALQAYACLDLYVW